MRIRIITINSWLLSLFLVGVFCDIVIGPLSLSHIALVSSIPIFLSRFRPSDIDSNAYAGFAAILVLCVQIAIVQHTILFSNAEVLQEILQWLCLATMILLGSVRLHKVVIDVRILAVVLSLFCAMVALYHIVEYPGSNFKKFGDAKYAFFFAVASCHFWVVRKKSLYSLAFYSLSLTLLVMSGERKALLAYLFLSFVSICLTRKFSISIWKVFNKKLFSVFMLSVFIWSFLYISRNYVVPSLDVFIYDFDSLKEALWVSNFHRALLFKYGFDLFEQNMFFGVGAKNLIPNIAEYFPDERFANYTHFYVLDILIEYGLVGLVSVGLAYYRLMLSVFYRNGGLKALGVFFSFGCMIMLNFAASNSTLLVCIFMLGYLRYR